MAETTTLCRALWSSTTATLRTGEVSGVRGVAQRPVGEEEAGAVQVAPPGRLVLVLHVLDNQLE